MPLRHSKETSPAEHAAMFDFLDTFYKQTLSNDVGGLLGQIALLRDVHPVARRDDGIWRKAVSLAVTGH